MQMPHPDNDSENYAHFVQDMILKRYLVFRFTLDSFPPSYDRILQHSYGPFVGLKIGSMLEPLPADKKYILCYIRSGSSMEQHLLLLDQDFMILLKPESQKSFVTTKATVVMKIKHKHILETMIDRKDPRVVVMNVLDEKNPNGYSEKRIVFEDWRKAIEIKDSH